MSRSSATVIGRKMLAGNDDLLRVDLSNNQFQNNFSAIVDGVKKNQRIIQLIMRNNQLNGPEITDELRDLFKDHPSLSFIDFSNSDLNINKNKLKNIGVQAIIEGILLSEGQSLISELNFSYNYLT